MGTATSLREDFDGAGLQIARDWVVRFNAFGPDALAKVRAILPKGLPIEIWFQDEARIGRKNKITRRWDPRFGGE